jgi:serine/threonine protein kinase
VIRELVTLPEGATIQGQNGERFVVEGLLGTGGFSAIYLVRDRRARNKLYALKEILDSNTRERRHLTFEGEILKRLDHPSLPHIYQVFENKQLNRIYILMDYIEGPDLETLRLEQPEKHFSLSLTLALMTPIIEAVGYLHHQQPPIIHRDIKPANIISPIGSGEPKLVDFGLAKEYIEEKTTNVFRYGTPGYAAAEQYGQGTNPRTDIYALGATIYTLLSGVVPVDALTRNLEHRNEDPLLPLHILNTAIPVRVSEVIEKAMSLRSEDRYATIEDFWQAMSVASMHQPQTGPIASNPVPMTSAQAVAEISKLTTYPLDKQADKIRSRLKDRRTQFTQKRIYTRKKVLHNILYILISCIVLGVAIDGFLLYAWSHHDTTTGQSATRNKVTPTPNFDPSQGCPKNELSQLATGSSNGYPQLALCYGGEIKDLGIDGGSSPAIIYNLHQQQSSISGQFSGLSMVGPFTGNLDMKGALQFTVTPLGENKPLLFTGNIRGGGTSQIVITFNDIDQNKHVLKDQYGSGVFIASATPSPSPTASSSS